MANVYPRNDRAFQRAVEVQRLVIPFYITHNATPASKVLSTDEPTICFLQAQGVTQISVANGALNPGESSPPFDLSAADATGDFNLMVNLQDQKDSVVKIMHAQISNRANGAVYPCYHNSTNPDIAGPNSNQMLLNCHSSVNLASTDIDGCLEIEYITAT